MFIAGDKMHIEDAATFIVNFIARPRAAAAYSDNGYDVYMPNVAAAYLAEVENVPQHLVRDHPRSRELMPFFFDAAWDLCRRGVLRPGVPNGGNTDNKGYSVTSLGRSWIESGALPMVLETTRLAKLFASLSSRLGVGFLQRANEAARCHSFGANLAACAMSGAAAESIVLAAAIAKTGDEAAVLKNYMSAQGRKRTIDSIIHGARAGIAEPFKAATDLLAYWRDEAAHGTASEISEIEAHTALGRLVRFAQFASDNWSELTA
jgi:hypothetical protein